MYVKEFLIYFKTFLYGAVLKTGMQILKFKEILVSLILRRVFPVVTVAGSVGWAWRGGRAWCGRWRGSRRSRRSTPGPTSSRSKLGGQLRWTCQAWILVWRWPWRACCPAATVPSPNSTSGDLPHANPPTLTHLRAHASFYLIDQCY